VWDVNLKPFLFSAAGAVALAGMAASASAAPTVGCSGGNLNLQNGCISFQGDGFYGNSGGGDTEARVEASILRATGVAVDINLYGKADAGQSSALFTFNGGANSPSGLSGTWSVVAPNVLIKYITVKAANSYALYEMPGAGVSSWTYSTEGILNNGGNQPNVSHISFWTADVATGAVPEPASWAMLIAGMGIVGFSMRRRNAKVSFA
jgi:hypothetical protein